MKLNSNDSIENDFLIEHRTYEKDSAGSKIILDEFKILFFRGPIYDYYTHTITENRKKIPSVIVFNQKADVITFISQIQNNINFNTYEYEKPNTDWKREYHYRKNGERVTLIDGNKTTSKKGKIMLFKEFI